MSVHDRPQLWVYGLEMCLAIGSPHLLVPGVPTKKTRLESIIQKLKPHFIYDCVSVSLQGIREYDKSSIIFIIVFLLQVPVCR